MDWHTSVCTDPPACAHPYTGNARTGLDNAVISQSSTCALVHIHGCTTRLQGMHPSCSLSAPQTLMAEQLVGDAFSLTNDWLGQKCSLPVRSESKAALRLKGFAAAMATEEIPADFPDEGERERNLSIPCGPARRLISLLLSPGLSNQKDPPGKRDGWKTAEQKGCGGKAGLSRGQALQMSRCPPHISLQPRELLEAVLPCSALKGAALGRTRWKRKEPEGMPAAYDATQITPLP